MMALEEKFDIQLDEEGAHRNCTAFYTFLSEATLLSVFVNLQAHGAIVCPLETLNHCLMSRC